MQSTPSNSSNASRDANAPPSGILSAGIGRGSTGVGTVGTGEWPRGQPSTSSRTNGYSSGIPSNVPRRPSLSTTLSHRSSADLVSPGPNSSSVYHPPHHFNQTPITPSAGPSSAVIGGSRRSNTISESKGEYRYSKEDMLKIFEDVKGNKALMDDKVKGCVSEDFAGTLAAMEDKNGSTWARQEGGASGDVCWDMDAAQGPSSLEEMTAEERELFSTSVNSTHKPQQQPPTPGGAVTGRKASISSLSSNLSPNRPSASSLTRRHTSDSPRDAAGSGPRNALTYGGDAPPRRRLDSIRDTANSNSTSDPFGSRLPSSLLTDLDSTEEPPEKKPGTPSAMTPGGSGRGDGFFKRIPSTSWGREPSGSGFQGGAFGSFALGSGTPAKTPGGSWRRQDDPDDKRMSGPGLDGVDEHDFDRPMSSDSDPFNEALARAAEDTLRHATSSERMSSPFGTERGSSQPRSGSLAMASAAPISNRRQADPFGNMSSSPAPQLPQQNPHRSSLAGSLSEHPEPLSPTETNPYQSPVPERALEEEQDHQDTPVPLPGFSSYGAPGMTVSSTPWGPPSAAPHEGSFMSRLFPLMAANQDGINVSSTDGTLSASALAGIGAPGSGPFANPNIGRPSRLGSLLAGDGALSVGLNTDEEAIVRSLEGMGLGRGERDVASPISGMNQFSSQPQSRFFGSVDSGDLSLSAQQSANNLANMAQAHALAAQVQQSLSHQTSSSSLPGQRVMIMPDKIQWAYKDPSGTVQGPFTGLEMHDWYKAGFFTGELLVKRTEETEWDQLGQLIRKIGNSREPFLVPMQGLAPVGASNLGWGPWDATGNQANQPPFPGSFPSFGTTLTADQQNALERRKQEEQYLMARQRDFLVQQQVLSKSLPFPPALHHQGSAHSLHSQPSFGSLTSVPVTAPFQMTPPRPQPPSFEPGALLRQAASDMNITPAELIALQGQSGFGAGGSQGFGIPGQQAAELQRLSLEQPQLQQLHGQSLPTHADLGLASGLVDGSGLNAQLASLGLSQALPQMLQHQQGLASQMSEALFLQTQESIQPSPLDHNSIFLHESILDETGFATPSTESFQAVEERHIAEPIAPRAATVTPPVIESEPLPDLKPAEPLPVRKKSPAVPEVPAKKRVWEPMPLSTNQTESFPPPLGVPFPRTTASPSVDTPVSTTASIAPWAKEPEAAAPRGPSLKEIQALEAKEAAKREESAALARQEAAKRELALEQARAAAVVAPAPGLPPTASWAAPSASAASPVTGPGLSVWNKPLAKGSAPASGKKTLQQIQQEEENRKAKIAATAAAALAANASALPTPTGPAVVAPGAKRYADSVAKPMAPPPATSGAWTTVGAKSKITAPAAPPPQILRAVSGPPGSIVNMANIRSRATPPPPPPSLAVPTRSIIPDPPAKEEFLKWCRHSLRGLDDGVDPEVVLSNILDFPPERDLIADVVYAQSKTMDARRFAEEFVRRKKASDKGVVIEASSSSSNAESSSGGWSEVAKKAPRDQAAPEQNPNFKVVAGKKGRGGVAGRGAR